MLCSVTPPMTKAAARRMLKTEKSGEDVSANITWPADGSTIKAMTKSKIKYQVRGANAYHARLYIDGKESDSLLKPHGIMDSLLKPNGSLRIAKLPVGEHELCIKTLNKSHNEIGKAGCIKVIAQ